MKRSRPQNETGETRSARRKTRTADFSAAAAFDADSARDTFGYLSDAARQRKRRRMREQRRGWAIFSVFALAFVVLMAMIQSSLADYRLFQNQVESKESGLRGLQTQRDIGQKRLAALQWEKGRTQSLIEHGYIRPGDRILLFPADEEPQRTEAPTSSAQSQKNDIAPSQPVTKQPAGGAPVSAWRRAGDTLGGWWKSLREASGATESETAATNNAAVVDKVAPDATSP